MSGIFKAYDVRGLYPEELDEATAERIGLELRHVLDPTDLARNSTVVVGHDMRTHSEGLERALIEGLLESGLDVIDIGLVTTPMNYFAVGHLQAAGGVQVTASHNPPAYNGFKFSRGEAKPVSGESGIPLLERRVGKSDRGQAGVRGTRTQHSIEDAYGAHVLSFLRPKPPGPRLRVVVDAANGMGCIYRSLLEAAEIDLDCLYFELDGTFPNHEANPLRLENLRDLSRRVVETGADLGVAFDGDADRAAFVDEKGEPVGSDLITALIAGELLAKAPTSAIVFDLRSSRAVPEYIRECGGTPIRERVGHSFIKATLRRHSGIFGGELAGHYYFRDHYFADNALRAVFEILNLRRDRGQAFSEIVRPIRRYAKSPEINFEVEDKQAMMNRLAADFGDAEIDHLDGITIQYPEWWFNVRPSNTEPLLRLVVEADSDQALAEKTEGLLKILGTPV